MNGSLCIGKFALKTQSLSNKHIYIHRKNNFNDNVFIHTAFVIIAFTDLAISKPPPISHQSVINQSPSESTSHRSVK